MIKFIVSTSFAVLLLLLLTTLVAANNVIDEPDAENLETIKREFQMTESFKRCDLHWRKEEYKQALDCMNQFIASNPDSPLGYIGIASYTISVDNDAEKGLNHLRIAMEKKNSGFYTCPIYIWAGEAYYRSRKFQEAKSVLRAAIVQCKNSKQLKSVKKQIKLIETQEMNQMRSNFISAYRSIEINMSKEQVANLVRYQPSWQKAVSLKFGLFECWTWHYDESENVKPLVKPFKYFFKAPPPTERYAVLFKDGVVVETGIDHCPNLFP
jgi:tetratricopeptide (TPR) repeat protein